MSSHPSTARDLSDSHRQHLLNEVGEEGLKIALQLGARSIDADEAQRLRFRYGKHRTGGLLLPFSGDFAQLRADNPPLDSKGGSVKYLNRKGAPQTALTVGDNEPSIATEGFKDAIALHLLTGHTVQAIPGVHGWRLLAASVRLLIYDADAQINPMVWAPLIRAGLERPALRLAFWPAKVAGAKGGACEFRKAHGSMDTITQFKARELLRELPKGWERNLRADFQPKAIKALARLGADAGMDAEAVEVMVVQAARQLSVTAATARRLAADVRSRHTAGASSVIGPPCPEEPTKSQLQRFLREKHSLRFNDLSQGVELDGRPMQQLDLADSLLAHLYGVETTKQAARDSFLYLAHCQRFNPVAEYLQGLRETPALQLMSLTEIAAAFGISKNDALSQELLARHLAGGYRRGLDPGFKNDQILTLQGAQGQGKSQTIRALAPPGMYDGATKVPKALEDREFLQKLNSSWIFEFDEIEKVLQSRDAAEFKGFLSRTHFRYVQKWETVCQEHPARALLFGTSNSREILNDHTGNRRIWLVPVGQCNPGWVRENRDSIWATIATWVEWGLESWIPEDHPAAIAAAERAMEAQISEVWEGDVRKCLEALPDPDLEGIAQDDLLRKVFEKEALGRVPRNLQMAITKLVTGAGFTTHDRRYYWVQKRRRYRGGPSRSGYIAIPVPTVPSCSSQIQDGWNGQTPWNDRNLTTLFQPFQPCGESSMEKGVMNSPCAMQQEPVLPGWDLPKGWNGRNTAEITSSAMVLRSCPPTEQGLDVGTGSGTKRNHTPKATEHRTRVMAIPIGAPVEIREPDRPTINGHRMRNQLGKSERCQLEDARGRTVLRPKAWIWPCGVDAS